MMALLDRVCMGWWFNGEGGMGKGLGVWLGEKGECAIPNRSVEGDDRWKGVGEVKHSSQREAGRGDWELLGRLDELGDIDWGDARM